MQLWPAKENAFAASFVAARSRSASAATTTGVELPSSSRTRFFAARSAMPQPTPLEPVKVIIRTRSSSTSTSPISLEGDRKSTRLNSSHEWISYAVFCLKKKKNKDEGTHTAQQKDSLIKRQ